MEQRKKVLHQMIGEKPASVEDPRRMEKNVFYIQINSMGQKVDIPLDAIRNLSQEEQKVWWIRCTRLSMTHKRKK